MRANYFLFGVAITIFALPLVLTRADLSPSGNAAPVSQSGTWSLNPVTTSGNALTAAAKASVTSSVNVKASAGNVYGLFALNGAASTCWVQFINSASAGTLGTGVIFSIPLPASITQPVYVQPAPFALSNFAAGIAVGIATTATGAVACGTAGNLTVFYD
jgi:hypothetical protein